jgi:protein kinase/serine/threonine-protein kinase
MSPEQAQGEEVDNRSDLFSFGVVLYELLAGKLPFRGEHQSAMMYSLMNEDPQPIARFNEKVSPDLERIVSKALAKDRDERYQHGEDLLADLRRERKSIEYAKAGYTTIASSPPSLPSSKSKSKLVVIGISAFVLVVAAVLLFVLNPSGSQKTSKALSADRKSIAVLPFSNLSESKEDEYFSDGITEDIITQLSKIGDLKVISRTSSMQYKGSKKSLREIGKELDVAAVLEGSIRRAGGRVRIVSQLIDASTDEHIWADTYDRDMKDIFEIQSDVAQKIAAALSAKLSPTEKANIERKPTENLEAYGLYLHGRESYYRYHKQENESAVTLFKKALELDPNYALAYAGLGDCYGQRSIKFGFTDAWIDSGIVASQNAIRIDPNCAEAYKALGLCLGGKGFINKALDAYYKSVERNPNYTPAVGNISIMNYMRGNFAESYRWALKDAKLSVVLPFTFLERGVIYYFLAEDDKALEWFNKSLNQQPDFMFALLMLSHTKLVQGDFESARTYVEKSLTLEPDNPNNLNVKADIELFARKYDVARELFRKALTQPMRLGDVSFRTNATGLGFALLKTGHREEGLKILSESRSWLQKEVEQLNELANIRYELATVSAAEGKQAESLDWLQKAVDLGWRNFRYTERDPMFEALSTNQRFQQIIADMKAKVEEQRKLIREMEKE